MISMHTHRFPRGDRGLTLAEIMMTLMLIALVGALGLSSLKAGREKAPTRGLTVALAEELRSARQVAIAEGHPVAIGMPTAGGTSPACSSVYRLEGWDNPRVTWAKSFKGDYPNEVFLPATWPGGSFTLNAPASPIAKFDLFNVAANLDEWIPDALENDYLFVFTPDGALYGNGLPAVNGQYAVVIGSDLALGASSLTAPSPGPPLRSVTAGRSIVTVLVSPTGGVTDVSGVPLGSIPDGGGGTPPSVLPPAPATITPSTRIKLSDIQVRPAPDPTVPNEGFCVPGQFVTFEVFARDPEGRELFARWNQGAEKGIFTYPDSDAVVDGTDINEIDRMEYVPDYDWGDGNIGAYRARWSWTVPLDTLPGDSYSVNVDVSDATGTAEIETPQPVILKAAPQGRMLVERLVNGEWKLFTMNPDGSAVIQLTPEGYEELMPSVDRTGNKVAFIEEKAGGFDVRRIRIRTIDNSLNKIVDTHPGRYTSVSLSPSGEWVSYRETTSADGSAGILHVTRVNGNSRFSFPQTHAGGGHSIRKSRTGFSPDSRWLFYEQGRDIWRIDLDGIPNVPSVAGDVGVLFFTGVLSSAPLETMFAPTPFISVGGQEMLLISVGNNNPRLIIAPVDFDDPSPSYGGGSMYSYTQPLSGASVGVDDDYPSVSSDGRYLSFTRSPQSSGAGYSAPTSDDVGQTLVVVEWGGTNFDQNVKVIGGDVRRSAWLPADDDAI